MRFRTTFFTSALVLFAGSVAVAQTPGGPRGQGFGQRRMERLLQGITLTAEQQAQVDSIVAQSQTRMPAFTPGSPPDQATRDKMRVVRQQQDSTIRALLTPDQQKTWDANAAEMRSRMRAPGD